MRPICGDRVVRLVFAIARELACDERASGVKNGVSKKRGEPLLVNFRAYDTVSSPVTRPTRAEVRKWDA